MATKPLDVFLSYTHFDDRDGRVNEFRRLLAETVQEVTGDPFAIFKDRDGIGIGEHWSDKLDQMLNEARFFIPVVTQSYLTSEACREELQKFLRAEAKRGRNDLVLPIYWIASGRSQKCARPIRWRQKSASDSTMTGDTYGSVPPSGPEQSRQRYKGSPQRSTVRVNVRCQK